MMGVADSENHHPIDIESEPDIPEKDLIILDNKFTLQSRYKNGRNRKIRKKKPFLQPEPHVSSSFPQSVFVDSLQLVPKSSFKKTECKEEKKDLQLDIIDLTDDPIQRTPTTPRILNRSLSLISSPSVPQKALFRDTENVKDVDGIGSDVINDDADDEIDDGDKDGSSQSSESEDEGVDREQHRLKRSVRKLLNSVDLSSPLGLLVRTIATHSIRDEEENELKYDEFCGTDGRIAQGKMRDRMTGFMTTYRSSRMDSGYNHKFCFTDKDRREFYLRLKTGLCQKSREKFRNINKKQCKLVLKNLNPAEIKKLSYVPTPRIRPSPRPKTHMQGLHNRSLNVPRFNQSLWNLGHSNPSAHLQPNAFQVYQQAQQQRQLHMQMMLAQKYPQLAQNPAALQQRLLLNQRIMAAAAAQKQKSSNVGPIPLGPAVANQAFQSYQTKQMRQNQRPSKPIRSDEVIAISDSDDDDDNDNEQALVSAVSPRNTISSHACPSQPLLAPTPAEAAKVDQQAVMFKCHLCGAEILFTQSTTLFIKEHFSKSHNVNNVQIIHNVDSNNQVTFSIIEGPTEDPLPQSSYSAPKLTQSLSSKPSISHSKLPKSSDVKDSDLEDVICID